MGSCGGSISTLSYSPSVMHEADAVKSSHDSSTYVVALEVERFSRQVFVSSTGQLAGFVSWMILCYQSITLPVSSLSPHWWESTNSDTTNTWVQKRCQSDFSQANALRTLAVRRLVILRTIYGTLRTESICTVYDISLSTAFYLIAKHCWMWHLRNPLWGPAAVLHSSFKFPV